MLFTSGEKNLPEKSLPIYNVGKKHDNLGEKLKNLVQKSLNAARYI